MDDDTIRGLARRMGGGHPLSEIRAEEHVAIHNTPVAEPEIEIIVAPEVISEPGDEEETDVTLEETSEEEVPTNDKENDGNA